MNEGETKVKEKNDLVILFSGGADSRLMLELALSNERIPLCILVDYGQGHIEELKFAKKQLEKKDVDYIEVKLPIEVNSGLTGDLERASYPGVHTMHVPGRNLIFISSAASIAESRGIDTVWYGPDWSDRLNNFPDCYQEWVVKVNSVLNINGSIPIKLEAPLLGMSKEFILSTLEKVFNVDIEKELFSGYGHLD